MGVAIIALLETLISAKIATKNTRLAFSSQREVYGL
jgi:MFS superfamily sulfate permease-like transporter